MIQKIIPYIILGQILIWLFHLGIGIEEWRNIHVFDSQTLFILFLGLGSGAIYLHLKSLSAEERTLKIVFEHALLLWIISWFFYHSWWNNWEVLLLIFIVISLVGILITSILESQLGKSSPKTTFIPDYFWWIGSLLTLINTISISLIFILLREELSTLWIFFGISWLFLWKKYPL